MFKNIFKKKTDAKVITEAEVEVVVEDIHVIDNESVYVDSNLQIEEVEETLQFPDLDQESEQQEFIEEENQLISDEPNLIVKLPEWDIFTSPEVVGWYSEEQQKALFDAALWLAFTPGQSILDVGCGRADLFPLAVEKGLVYKGIDYNPNIINIARQKYPKVSVETIDVFDIDKSEDYDWVIGSGLFNMNMTVTNPENYAQAVVALMYDKAKIGVAFNLLTSIPEDIADEDKQQLIVWEPAAWLAYLQLTYKKVVCRTDYFEGDTTFYILK